MDHPTIAFPLVVTYLDGDQNAFFAESTFLRIGKGNRDSDSDNAICVWLPRHTILVPKRVGLNPPDQWESVTLQFVVTCGSTLHCAQISLRAFGNKDDQECFGRPEHGSVYLRIGEENTGDGYHMVTEKLNLKIFDLNMTPAILENTSDQLMEMSTSLKRAREPEGTIENLQDTPPSTSRRSKRARTSKGEK